MKRIVTAAFCVALLAAPAFGQAKPKLTVRQALSLLAALRNLDGHVVGNAMVPWDFQSGSLRLRIAGDISLLDPIDHLTELGRQQVFKEVAGKMPLDKEGKAPSQLAAGTPEFNEYQRQYDQLLDAPSPVSDALARIKASDLKLDKNDIPVTALSALSPILDDDVSPK